MERRGVGAERGNLGLSLDVEGPGFSLSVRASYVLLFFLFWILDGEGRRTGLFFLLIFCLNGDFVFCFFFSFFED